MSDQQLHTFGGQVAKPKLSPICRFNHCEGSLFHLLFLVVVPTVIITMKSFHNSRDDLVRLDCPYLLGWLRHCDRRALRLAVINRALISWDVSLNLANWQVLTGSKQNNPRAANKAWLVFF